MVVVVVETVVVVVVAGRHRQTTPPTGSTWHVVPGRQLPPHAGGLASAHPTTGIVVVVLPPTVVVVVAGRHRHTKPPTGSTWHVVPARQLPPHVGGLESAHPTTGIVVVVLPKTVVVVLPAIVVVVDVGDGTHSTFSRRGARVSGRPSAVENWSVTVTVGALSLPGFTL